MLNLGLPLSYQKFPEFFDDCENDGGWIADKVNSTIEGLLQQCDVKTVLDMTCGTGSQVLYLKAKGYDVVGSDFSPKLLEIAREKAKKLDYNLQFIDGDMRALQVGKFDAVITIFNAIGHFTKSDFSKAIQNINSNLNVDGVYLFDIFNLQAITDEVVADFAYQWRKKIDNKQILGSQCSIIDRESGLLISYDQCIVQSDAEEPVLYENKFALQIYSITELKMILQDAGFKLVLVRSFVLIQLNLC